MMNDNSFLFPSELRGKSRAVINALLADNTNLERIKTAIRGVTEDLTIRAGSFDNVKLKLSDYLLLIDALILANEADITDHRELISVLAENTRLIGSDILREFNYYREAAIAANTRIDFYTDIINSTTWLQRLLNHTKWQRHSNAVTGRGIQQGIFDNANRIVWRMKDRMQRYSNIENATRSLFTLGNELRATALDGLEFIEVASINLPDDYTTFNLAAWRADVQNGKDVVFAAALERLTIIGEYGNIILNWEAIEDMLSNPINELGRWEVSAFVTAFENANASTEDFDRLFDIIRQVDGADAADWVRNSYATARDMLLYWGGNSGRAVGYTTVFTKST